MNLRSKTDENYLTGHTQDNKEAEKSCDPSISSGQHYQVEEPGSQVEHDLSSRVSSPGVTLQGVWVRKKEF